MDPFGASDYEYCDEGHPLLCHVRCFVCQSPAVLPVRLPHADLQTDCGATACRGCYEHFARHTSPGACARCPNCRRPCALLPTAPDPVILRLLGSLAVRCGHCATESTVGEAVTHLRDCVPRRLAHLAEGHDWSRAPHGVCRDRMAECTPVHCAWSDVVQSLVTPRNGPGALAVHAFLCLWMHDAVAAGDGYALAPQFVRLLQDQPALTTQLWTEAAEAAEAGRRPPGVTEVVEILRRLDAIAASEGSAAGAPTYDATRGLLDRAVARAVALGDGADAAGLVEYRRRRPWVCLPLADAALRAAASAVGPPGCSATVAALCTEWLLLAIAGGGGDRWTQEVADALFRQPLLPSESLAALAVALWATQPEAAHRAAAVWRDRRTREGAFPLPRHGSARFSWRQAAATLLSLTDPDDAPALMRLLEEYVRRAFALADVRLVDYFGAALAGAAPGDAGVAALAGGIVARLLCGDAGPECAFALAPWIAVAVPVAGLALDGPVRAIENEARLLAVHRGLPDPDPRVSQLGFFVVVARILGNNEQEVNGFLAAYRNRLRRAAGSCLPLAAGAADPPFWSVDRGLRTRVVLLLIGLYAAGWGPADDGGRLADALRWLSLQAGSLPRARWWYDLTLVRQLSAIPDAALLDPVILALVMRRVGFGRRGGGLEQRLLGVHPSNWTPEATLMVMSAAPRGFIQYDLVWGRLFAPSVPRQTAEAIVGRSGAAADWVFIRLHHVLPSDLPAPSRTAGSGGGFDAAALRLVHAGGDADLGAFQETLSGLLCAEGGVARRWFAAASEQPALEASWWAVQAFVLGRMLPWARRFPPAAAPPPRLPDAFLAQWIEVLAADLREGPDGGVPIGWLGTLGAFVRLAGDRALGALCDAFIRHRPVMEDLHRHRAVFEPFLSELRDRTLQGGGGGEVSPSAAELCLFLCLEASPEFAARFPADGLGTAAAGLTRCNVGSAVLCAQLNRAAVGGAHDLWATVVAFNPYIRSVWVSTIEYEDNFGAFGGVMAALGESPAMSAHAGRSFVGAAVVLVLEHLRDRLVEADSDVLDEPAPSDVVPVVRVALDLAAADPSVPLLRVLSVVHPDHLGDANPDSLARLVRCDRSECLPFVALLLCHWLGSNTAQTVQMVLGDSDGLALLLTRLVRDGSGNIAELLEGVVSIRRRELAEIAASSI